MLRKILNISTNFDHWRHPLTLNAGLEKPLIWKRVAGVALFILGLLLILPTAFILGTATWKCCKHKAQNKMRISDAPTRNEMGPPSNAEDHIHNSSYNLDNEVSKVQKLAKELPQQNKKLCLFVGITSEEQLPSDKGTAEIDEVWVSMDIEPVKNKLDPSRTHLQIDMNNNDQCKRIEGCFHKVVLDLSVLKFFINTPWLRLKRFLNLKEDSVLITEATTGSPAFIDNISSNPISGSLAIPATAYTFARENRPQKDGQILTVDQLIKKHRDQLQEGTEKYLRTLFKTVQFKDEAYPYPNARYPEVRGYYVLTGPLPKMPKSMPR